jgi:hypothetical protein
MKPRIKHFQFSAYNCLVLNQLYLKDVVIKIGVSFWLLD